MIALPHRLNKLRSLQILVQMGREPEFAKLTI
jgi:hypothetical protein